MGDLTGGPYRILSLEGGVLMRMAQRRFLNFPPARNLQVDFVSSSDAAICALKAHQYQVISVGELFPVNPILRDSLEDHCTGVAFIQNYLKKIDYKGKVVFFSNNETSLDTVSQMMVAGNSIFIHKVLFSEHCQDIDFTMSKWVDLLVSLL